MTTFDPFTDTIETAITYPPSTATIEIRGHFDPFTGTFAESGRHHWFPGKDATSDLLQQLYYDWATSPKKNVTRHRA